MCLFLKNRSTKVYMLIINILIEVLNNFRGKINRLFHLEDASNSTHEFLYDNFSKQNFA